MTKVKICGLTSPDDAVTAEQKGAHCLGMIFSNSSRQISVGTGKQITKQISPFTLTAGVFVNETLTDIKTISEQVGIDIIQLHGNESPEFVTQVKQATGLKILKAIRIQNENSLSELNNYDCDGFLLDAYSETSYGGSGKRFDLNLFPKNNEDRRKDSRKNDGNLPLILAGGLNPDNVEQAVSKVNPYAVCVSSGVEEKPGKKSAAKVEQFIKNILKGSELTCNNKKDISENMVEDLSRKHLWVP